MLQTECHRAEWGCCPWCAGLQITDASSLADYMPSDVAPALGSGPAPALEDTTLPLPRQQPLGTAALSRTPPMHPHEQLVGVTQTPLPLSRQAMLPETDISSRGMSALMQHGVVDRQEAQDSGQKVPIGASLPLFTAQRASTSGQKRPAGGQSQLDEPQSSKRSRQTTLNNGLKGAPTVFKHMGRPSKEGQSAGSNRQTPSHSRPAFLHWPISRETPGCAGTAQHAKQYRAGVSPHEHVAQVLDLTQADEEPATGTRVDPHTGTPHVQPSASLSTGSGSKGRRKVMLQPQNASSPRETANLVDLT